MSQVGPVDIAVTDAMLRGAQIQFRGRAYNASIQGNVLSGGLGGIRLDGEATAAFNAWNNVVVARNIIYDFSDFGFYASGRGTVTVEGNTIDGDPFLRSPYRAPGGKWGDGFANLRAVRAYNTVLAARYNSIRNVGRVFTGTAPTDHLFDANILYCNPVAHGVHADNVGIADIANPGLYGSVVIEDGDPASATFGTVLNTCPVRSQSMPTSGKYVTGHVVWSAGYLVQGSAGNQYTVLGWRRLTTGTGHVLGTDWAPLKCLA